MPTSSHPRVLWKGAISFGLVHIPIALYPATSEQGLNFDWLDRRSMDPVGYKRVNKRTGKEIAREDIVKGIEYEDGQYVVLSPQEIEAAYPKTTQTIEIETFVPAGDIPFLYLDRPYYVAPINRGAKVYALLREILSRSNKVAIARVVIQTKQHLAALIPFGPVLVLNLLRWGDEIRAFDSLALPPEGIKAAGVTDKEMKIGEQLVEDMTTAWDPSATHDSFKEQILRLVETKAHAGKLESVTPLEPVETPATGATIYDLTELLQRSLEKGRENVGKSEPRPRTAAKPAKASAKPPGGKPGSRRKAA
jgi:DNA end-binding protein Ku